jgi:hypothetical protein
MKTSSNYKMPKALKTRLSRILDPHKKGEWKRAMIGAELYAIETAKQFEKGRNKSEGQSSII